MRYVSLAEYLRLAEDELEIPAETLQLSSRLDLADSALNAPAAGFGGIDFYPDLYSKAAVLVCRLVWNHPLMDGNKRTALSTMSLFIEHNLGTWIGEPNPGEEVSLMLAIANRSLDEDQVAEWLRERVQFPAEKPDPV